MKRLFLDSDIILDLLAERNDFYNSAANIFKLAYEKEIEIFTSPVVFANVFYILRKIIGKDKAKEQLRDLRLIINILSINEGTVDLAFSSTFKDFEDALQYFMARENTIPVIVSRNIKDYKVKDIIIQTSMEFIQMYKTSTQFQ